MAEAVEAVGRARAVEQHGHQLLDRAGVVEARGQLVELGRGRHRLQCPSWFSRWASGIVATSGGWDCCAAAPSSISAVRAALRERRQLLELAAERRRALAEALASGVPWSASVPEVGHQRPQLAQEAGSSWIEREMSAARAALATEVVFACVTKSASAFRCRASGASTVSESVASWASCRFWLARIFSTWSV